MSNPIPPPREPIADANGVMSASWYRYFASVGVAGGLQKSGGTATSSRTLTATDLGLCVEVGAGGSIIIPNATFSNGGVIWLYNDTSGGITVTCSIATAYISGVNTDKASMTLATRGLAMIRFKSGTECVVQGSVS